VNSMQQYHPNARDLLCHGYSIIPTRLDKKPNWNLLPKDADGKATWKPYQERKPHADEMERWDKASPPAYSIVTGRLSGVVTLDFDGEPGRELARQWGIRPHRKTGSGGLHWDVRYPGHYVPTLNGKAKENLGRRWRGLDIKGDGGYVVAFGRNKNGRYQWLRDIDADPPELVPAEVWQFLNDYTTRPAGANGQAAHVPPERLIKMALEQIPHTGRNSAGFWLACQLRDHGYSIADARSVLSEYRNRCPNTNTKGQPEKYSDEEVQATLDQAYSRPARGPWSAAADASAGDDAAAEPPANQRPKERPNQPTNDQPNEPPKRSSRFVVTPNSVLYVEESTNATTFVCSHLRIEALTRDCNGSEWGRLLVWTDSEGRQKRWAMPMELLAGDGTELRKELLRGGLIPGFSAKATQLLPQYILSEKPQELALCVPKLGWNDDVYVLPDMSIPQNATRDRVIFQGPGYLQHYYSTAGTLDEWRQQVSVPCQGNSRLIFSISMAFAAPLLAPLGIEGGGFHITGSTSIGKSTMQIVAGSVLGGGNGDHGFCRSWRHTANGLEAVALIHNDSLLILDELREMSDPKEVEGCVYMLANGSAKGRMSRSGSGTRPASTWRILFLSSGEFPLSEYAAAVGRKIKGGAEVRLINLPADAGDGLGIFESLHGENSARAFAQKLKSAALTVYGTPIRAFLARFASERDKRLNEARAYMAGFINDQLPKGAATEVGRALQRFAIVAAVGEMAIDMGISDWATDTATWGVTRCINDWIEYRGGVGQADMQAALRQVRAFFETHGASRFQSVITRMDTKSGDAIEERILNRAGYTKHDQSGERLFLVFPEVFRREVCAGFDYNSVAAELARENLLVKGDGRNTMRRESVPDQDRPRFYVVRGRILE
jgi:uncharacterized protein (DUF927 family)